MIWVPLLFILVAAIHDLRTREVPDAIALALLGWATVATALRWHDVGWASMLGGLVIGLVLSMSFFALGGLGGGDVKLIAALGAALGHAAIVPALFWIAIAGGLLAIVALLRGRRDLAYLPAIALGLIIDLIWREPALHAFSS
jgi:prepilin peptidase CpaA